MTVLSLLFSCAAPEVVEGDPDVPIDHEDNVVLGSFQIELPDRATIAEKGIDVTYSYDLDGILQVSVSDKLTGSVLREEEISYGASSDKRELVAIASRVNETMDTQQVGERTSTADVNLPAEVALLVQRAKTKVIPFLDHAEAERIRGLVRIIEDGAGANHEAVRSLEEALAPYSYLF